MPVFRVAQQGNPTESASVSCVWLHACFLLARSEANNIRHLTAVYIWYTIAASNPNTFIYRHATLNPASSYASYLLIIYIIIMHHIHIAFCTICHCCKHISHHQLYCGFAIGSRKVIIVQDFGTMGLGNACASSHSLY